MAVGKPIRVELGARQRAILKRQLESGLYENASEVIGDALRALDRRDAMFDAWLREDVSASVTDKRPTAPIEEVFRRAHAKVNRKAKARVRGA